MNRYVPYLGIVAAIAVIIVIASNMGGATELQVLPAVDITATQAATTTAPTVLKALATTSSSKSLPTNQDLLAEAAGRLNKALINIVCYAPPHSGLHSISGSGVIISPAGMILTNAHVAEYYLLADRGVSCDVRAGSPAAPAYKAEIAYIPPRWIQENATTLTQDAPMGTGERDFALLAITDATAAVPYVPLAYTSPSLNQSVAIASYGAQDLTASQIKSGFFSTVVLNSIKKIFTFGTSTPDVLFFEGTPAAQEGSSGGGVVDARGSLVATIVTSNVEGAIAERTLSAITALYIRAEYERETGHTLDSLLAMPNAVAVAGFEEFIPALQALLVAK